MPLIPAMRPFNTSSRAAEAPISKPPMRAETGVKFSMNGSDQWRPPPRCAQALGERAENPDARARPSLTRMRPIRQAVG